MKTLFASIMMAVAVPAIVSAHWPLSQPHPFVKSAWYTNHRTGLRLTYTRDDSLERFTQQLYWDDYDFQNALRRAVRGDDIRSPWTIDYSEPITEQTQVNSYPPSMDAKPIRTRPTYKPQNNSKVYSIKEKPKLPKTKPGKPGELRKPNWIK